MGLFKWVLIVVAVLVALAFFMPAIFDQIKNFSINKTKNLIPDKEEENITIEVKNYGKILGFMECSSDNQCYDFFSVKGIECITNKTCAVI